MYEYIDWQSKWNYSIHRNIPIFKPIRGRVDKTSVIETVHLSRFPVSSNKIQYYKIGIDRSTIIGLEKQFHFEEKSRSCRKHFI